MSQATTSRPDASVPAERGNPDRRLRGLTPPSRYGARVSIVVLTHNAAYWTERCLASLFTWTATPHELIIVDNASDASTLAVLDRYEGIAGVTIHRNPENVGFAAGNNIGLEHASQDLVLFLNSDVIVTPNWLTTLVSVLDRRPEVAAVGPRSNHAKGVQGGVSLPSYAHEAIAWFGSHFNWHDPGRWYEVESLSGYALLMRRAVLDQVGSFDERFAVGSAEDTELCDRIRQAGHALICAGDCFVFHAGHVSFLDGGVNFAHQNNLNRLDYEARNDGSATAREVGEAGRSTGDRNLLAELGPTEIVSFSGGSRYVHHQGVLHPIAGFDVARLLPYPVRDEPLAVEPSDDVPVGEPVFFARSWELPVYLLALGRRHRLEGCGDRIARLPGVSVLRPEQLDAFPDGPPIDVDERLEAVSELASVVPRSLLAGFEERLVGTEAIASRIELALELGQPLSLVRLGSGEAIMLNDGVLKCDLEPFNTDYSGGATVPRGVRAQLIEAVREADIVGVTTDDEVEYCTPLLERLFTHLHIAPRSICSAYVNWNLIGVDRDNGDRVSDDPPLPRLLRGRRVAVVGRLAGEAERRQAELGWTVTVATGVDGFDDVERALATLCDHRDEFDVAIVAAGVPAVLLCPALAAKTGRVAVDFGHSLNYLLNPFFNEATLQNEKLRWRFEQYVGERDRPVPRRSELEGRFCKVASGSSRGAIHYIESGRCRHVRSRAIVEIFEGDVVEVDADTLDRFEVGLPLAFVADELGGAFLIKDGQKVEVDFGVPLVGCKPQQLLELPTAAESLRWEPGATGGIDEGIRR